MVCLFSKNKIISTSFKDSIGAYNTTFKTCCVVSDLITCLLILNITLTNVWSNLAFNQASSAGRKLTKKSSKLFFVLLLLFTKLSLNWYTIYHWNHLYYWPAFTVTCIESIKATCLRNNTIHTMSCTNLYNKNWIWLYLLFDQKIITNWTIHFTGT